MRVVDRAVVQLCRLACAAALLLLAAPAPRAEDTAALMARAPALPLSAPVTRLGAAVEVATAGWGPFRRLCVYRTMQRVGESGDRSPSAPFCLTVEAAREEAGTWQLSLRTVPRSPAPALSFATSRDAQGQVGPVVITIPEGATAPTAQQAAQMEALFRATIAANGMSRATIAPDTSFILPLGLDAAAPDLRVEGGGFTCMAEGETRIEDRRAIMARCTGRAAGRMAGSPEMTIDMAGRFAIDVATGMVLRHGYASFLVIAARAAGEAPIELRGTSRQILE
jgi:hypothetical protein